jgi:hypothetical protein
MKTEEQFKEFIYVSLNETKYIGPCPSPYSYPKTQWENQRNNHMNGF